MSNRRIKKKKRGIGIVESLIASFVIGNVIAWSMGAYPRNFDEIPMDQDTQETVTAYEEFLKENPDDVEMLTEYGGLLSSYNKMDEAEERLEKAYQVNPNYARAGAWLGSNRIKQAGASIDLTWGIPKLMSIKSGVELLNESVEKDPDDLIVRIIRLSTIALLKRNNFNELCSEEAILNPDVVEEALKTDASIALASYFSANPECNTPSDNLQKAKKYQASIGSDLTIIQKMSVNIIAEQLEALENEV